MGRRILITGASTGIGAATAVRFATSGATIGIHYFRSTAAAKEVAAAVEAKGATPILLQGDLTRPEVCEKVIQAFVWQSGGMDVLINNAGGVAFASGLERRRAKRRAGHARQP